MDKPTYEDAEKCIDIRKRSKRGDTVSREEHDFSRQIYLKYYDWYSASEARVFNETVPFGLSASIKDDLYKTGNK